MLFLWIKILKEIHVKKYILAFTLLLINTIFLFGAENIDNFEEKVVVLIIGTGRCGSSCLTGILNIMGLEIGDSNDLYKPDKYNEKGYFESNKIEKLNNSILSELNMIPIHNELRIVEWDAESKFELIKNKVKECIIKNFNGYSKFALKSPRISHFLRPYVEALQDLGYKVKLIMIVREPAEVIKSFQSHSVISNEQQYRNAARILTAMIIDAANMDRLVIKYEDLLNNNLEKTLQRLVDYLPWLKSYNECKAGITNFIDKSLKHF